MKEIDINLLLKGDRRQLAKSITLIESSNEKDKENSEKLINKISYKTGKSIRIGISGIPGVGKSTFIESLGTYLVNQNKKIAILAVDPSSPINGGSIMGDKSRMEQLSQHKNAFIRPTPTKKNLGGVANKTRETILLCEAAGFEIILIETVGVGQSEHEVSQMTDLLCVLFLPNSGDEIQGIKRGIMELADILIINKSDNDQIALSKIAKQIYKNAISFLNHKEFWTPKVLTCSSIAKDKKDIELIWNTIEKFIKKSKESLFFTENRSKQDNFWIEAILKNLITEKIQSDDNIKNKLQSLKQDVQEKKITPSFAAKELFKIF